ncbi:hypothetical protein Bealeia1_00223 [Candidatus Bealeia paramacronuclearis]|uniref:Uncharacterized protein n=2 Tax=Candidatus Bealeia paramacronuclearis TaxID=1921001 RepID=A0ABZ2C1A3_9PROT|nr:hypothetical protein [Candidatus Bealeia paramacronuclearis]
MNFFKIHQRLFTFFGLSIVGFLGMTLYLESWSQEKEDYLQQQKQTEQRLLSNIRELKAEVAFLKEHRTRFEALLQKGWRKPLERQNAAQAIEELAQTHHLNQVDYVLIPLSGKSTALPEGIRGHQVHLKFSGVLDSDVFQFIEDLPLRLSGHTMPTSLSLLREDLLNEESLNELVLNNKPNFVRGEYTFNWVTDATAD